MLALALARCAPSSPAESPETEPEVPSDVVERSALPLHILVDGKRHEFSTLGALLDDASAICLGESHDNPHHHYAQWRVVEALAEDSQRRGTPFGVGFEMFPRATQPALNAYSASGDVDQLLGASEWKRVWGFPFSFYQPIVQSARDAGGSLLALNAPREWTRGIAKSGLQGVDPKTKAALPELDLLDAEHRRFFRRAMGLDDVEEATSTEATPTTDESVPPAHGSAAPEPSSSHGHLNFEHLYAAQTVWDETMADTAAAWLHHTPGARLAIIAGSGHCHRSAIPKRMERRDIPRVIAARALLSSELGKDPVLEDGQFDLIIVLDESAPPPNAALTH